jgi:hypothetical protein
MRRSEKTVGVDDRLRKWLWRFSRQVVADATPDDPVLVPARKLVAIRRIIAFQRDRRQRNHGSFGNAFSKVSQLCSPSAKASRNR